MSNPDGVARRCLLPNDDFDPAWNSIMLAEGIRERLLAQSLLSFTVRQKLPFESAPLTWLDSSDRRARHRKDNTGPRPREPGCKATLRARNAPMLRSIRTRS